MVKVIAAEECPARGYHVAARTDQPAGIEVPQIVQPVRDADLVADGPPRPRYRRRMRRQPCVAAAGKQPTVGIVAWADKVEYARPIGSADHSGCTVYGVLADDSDE